ncbi:MAG: DUF2306 domain-containing protein [Hyphomonadaceae bacterium]|nr:DUF2306 domain-containing protein [Hyphomonadaceae bacterium]
MSVASIASGVTWGVIALLSVGVGGYALFHAGTGFVHLPITNPMFDPWGLQTHVAASGVAMLLGAFQFLKPLRRKAPTLHRWMGRVYVLACVVGGLAGVSIALSSTAGPIAGWGFFMLGLLWVPFTLMALVSAMRRDFTSHEIWMIRSFALTFGAVTLRLQLPIAGALGEAGLIPSDFVWSYQYIAWLAWVPNLIVAELFIATIRKPRRPKVAPSPTPA